MEGFLTPPRLQPLGIRRVSPTARWVFIPTLCFGCVLFCTTCRKTRASIFLFSFYFFLFSLLVRVFQWFKIWWVVLCVFDVFWRVDLGLFSKIRGFCYCYWNIFTFYLEEGFFLFARFLCVLFFGLCFFWMREYILCLCWFFLYFPFWFEYFLKVMVMGMRFLGPATTRCWKIIVGRHSHGVMESMAGAVGKIEEGPLVREIGEGIHGNPSKPYSLLPNSETPNGPSLLPLSLATVCFYTQFLYTFNLITLKLLVHFHSTSRLVDRLCCVQNWPSDFLNWSNLIF